MPARVVDLRSDTVTHPTPAMRAAMASAEVGDDGHGEDPTVKWLEALAAERLGTEAAVLVSSGTMGNLAGALTQTEPGDTMIVGAYCHPSLKAAAERYAQRDGVSLNQFISMAVAEKVGAAGAVEFFEKRSAGGKPERALAFLAVAPDRPPLAGDEPPN